MWVRYKSEPSKPASKGYRRDYDIPQISRIIHPTLGAWFLLVILADFVCIIESGMRSWDYWRLFILSLIAYIYLGLVLARLLSIIRGSDVYIVVRGFRLDRSHAARSIISSYRNSEILCENPLIIRIKGGYGKEPSVEAMRERMHLDISIYNHHPEKDGVKCQDTASIEGVGKTRGGFINMVVPLQGFASVLASNSIARTASLAVPSIVSTIGRLINDLNLVIVGSAIGGGMMALQAMWLNRARLRK